MVCFEVHKLQNLSQFPTGKKPGHQREEYRVNREIQFCTMTQKDINQFKNTILLSINVIYIFIPYKWFCIPKCFNERKKCHKFRYHHLSQSPTTTKSNLRLISVFLNKYTKITEETRAEKHYTVPQEKKKYTVPEFSLYGFWSY